MLRYAPSLLAAALLAAIPAAGAQSPDPAAATAPVSAEAAPAAEMPATEGAPATAPAAGTTPEDTRALDEQIQSLKKDAVDLNRELFMLEEELLFPANTQAAVFLSMDVGEFFAIDSVQVQNRQQGSDQLSLHAARGRSPAAGGVQRLYLGNLKVGEHELVAMFTGKGPNEHDYRRGAAMRFKKAVGAKYLELKISDRQRRGQPEFEIKDWE